MRVLLVCHGLPPESVGGVEQHVDGLAAALVQLGHQVHIYARTSAPGRAQAEVFREREGNPAVTRVVYRWEGITGFDECYEVPALDLAMRQFLAMTAERGDRFDAAHVHHLTGLSTGVLRELAAARVPTVLTLHDYWLMCPRGQMFHRREELCERVAIERCAECLQQTYPHLLQPATAAATTAHVHQRARELLALPQRLVVPSARVIPAFAELGVPRERFTVVENGVDTEALQALPPPPCGPGPLRLGYLGTLIPSKGLHVLIEAVQRQAPGRVELHVFGNTVSYHGDEGFLTRAFSRLRPGDPVHYHGPYAANDLPRILARLDVLAAPALWHEAFGLTVREALAAGRPVLVSRLGGLQDAVVDGVQGLVLPPGDVAAWSTAIASLAADRELVRTLAQGTRKRARGFLPMATELAQIYAAAGRT